MSPTLLPPNATQEERALEQATARLGDMAAPLRETWNPDSCPADLLPWLAWALQVDIWDKDWSDDTQRAVIRGAIEVHRRKGTPWAIKRALLNAGYGDATLSEGDSANTHDGADLHDGSELYVGSLDWAKYRLIMKRPITNAQAAQIRRLLATVAPARCHLVELVFTQIANLYNGAVTHDGAYNHGVA
jgi:phage tail P2-like protein